MTPITVDLPLRLPGARGPEPADAGRARCHEGGKTMTTRREAGNPVRLGAKP